MPILAAIILVRALSGAGSSQVMGDDYSAYVPYAFVIRGSDCRKLGRGVVDGKIAPDNLNDDMQTYVAARWFGTHLRELGPDDALAINANGLTVGADAVPASTRMHDRRLLD